MNDTATPRYYHPANEIIREQRTRLEEFKVSNMAPWSIGANQTHVIAKLKNLSAYLDRSLTEQSNSYVRT